MKNFVNKYKRELVVLLATFGMGLIFTIMNPNFMRVNNIITILQQMVLNGVLAAGIMFAIITGGIDLSIGCTFAITGIVTASLAVNGTNPYLAIVAGLAVGAVLGAFNGFLVTGLKLQPFIATLGTMSLYRGIAYVITGGMPVTGVPSVYRDIFNGRMFGNVRWYILVMIVIFIIIHIMLSRTRTGDYLYAVGDNEEAAKLSGVNVVKVKYVAYIVCGMCSAAAGLIMLASLGSAESTAGLGYETNA
ncbi:MAG: ABC transporter permease, partial [Synergistaceae bacterium]|nr:ABC transporter permease [Synergistaceae bacterium]